MSNKFVTIIFARKYHSILLLSVCAFMLALHALGESTLQALAFKRSLIESGEWWRLYTGQWVHFTWSHALMNTGATAAVLFSLFFTTRLSHTIWAVFCLPLLVGLSVWFFSVNVEHYRGYSAAIHGLITCGLLSNIREEPKLMSVGLVGITAKVVYEHTSWYDVNAMRDSIASAVAIDAHLYGYLFGLLLAGWFLSFHILFRRASAF